MSVLNHFAQIDQLINTYSYFAVFTVMFLAQLNISLPIPLPSELTLLYTGYKIYMHKFILSYAVFVGITGDFLGAILLFIIFYYLSNHRFVQSLFKRFLPKKFMAYHAFESKYNWVTILIGRSLPYGRNYVTILSGILKFPVKKFTFLSVIPSSVRALFFIFLGIQLGPKLMHLQLTIGKYSSDVMFGSIGILFLVLSSLIVYSNRKTALKFISQIRG